MRMNKIKSGVKFGDKDYALVPDRLKAFREANPRASIETEPMYQADGSLIFKATIITDLADSTSSRATGHARYSVEELKKPKAFEKLETVSSGRALAQLGYLNDGQIATSEEMEEFEAYQTEKLEQAILSASVVLQNAKTMKDLAKAWNGLPASLKQQLTTIKDECKAKLENKSNENN